MDHSEGIRLARLGGQQASDNKQAVALEAGRTYGMRTAKFHYQMKKKLRREFTPAPVAAMW